MKNKSFNFDEIQFINLFFLWIMLMVSYMKSWLIQVYQKFLCLILEGFFVLVFIYVYDSFWVNFRNGLKFDFFLHMISNFSSIVCCKDYPLSTELPLHLCQRSVVNIWEYFFFNLWTECIVPSLISLSCLKFPVYKSFTYFVNYP